MEQVSPLDSQEIWCLPSSFDSSHVGLQKHRNNCQVPTCQRKNESSFNSFSPKRKGTKIKSRKMD